MAKTRRSLTSILNPQKKFMKGNRTVGHILRNNKKKAKRVNFSNTCGFDAFVACLCTLYRDKHNQEPRCEIETNMELLIKLLVNTGYDKRAEALKELILSQMLQVPSNIFNSLDCNNNVCFFLEKSDFFSYNLTKSERSKSSTTDRSATRMYAIDSDHKSK